MGREPDEGDAAPVSPAHLVAVVGAGGGVGASTFAALLARQWSRRGPTALVDLDPSGGGIDVLLGIESSPGIRWPELAAVRGALEPEDLADVLPCWAGVEVLAAGRGAEVPGPSAVGPVLDSLAARCTTVVVDVPAAAVQAAAAPECEDVVLVAGQDVRGVAAGLAVRESLGGAAHLVLRRRRTRQVAPLEAAHVLDLPLLGMVPTDRRLAGAVDRGLGPVAGRRLLRSAAAVAEAVTRVGGMGGVGGMGTALGVGTVGTARSRRRR